MISDTDLKHLRRCVELAKIALEKGDEPFGSVLVSGDGKVLFEDHNHVAGGDHTQHPEFAIARWAANNMVPEEERRQYIPLGNIALCALRLTVGLVSIESFMQVHLNSWYNG